MSQERASTRLALVTREHISLYENGEKLATVPYKDRESIGNILKGFMHPTPLPSITEKEDDRKWPGLVGLIRNTPIGKESTSPVVTVTIEPEVEVPETAGFKVPSGGSGRTSAEPTSPSLAP